jgi:mannose-1-phosphate guanylyltransferase
MLQHTLARAYKLVCREHQVILIAETHRHDFQPRFMVQCPGKVIVQPSNRDTLPGIFLPLTHVYAHDPNATVLIYPSDHFIYPQDSFLRVMAKAVQAAEEMPQILVLIGASADSPETEYGWICPGREIWKSGRFSMRAVKRFREKPSGPEAAEALARGELWNTLIMVVKAKTLWQLGQNNAPEVLKHFERLFNAAGRIFENDVVRSIYENMPKRNFSTDLLTQAVNQIGVIAMDGVLWSDWGRKERIMETLRRIGKQPNFPTELLEGGDRHLKLAIPSTPKDRLLAG